MKIRYVCILLLIFFTFMLLTACGGGGTDPYELTIIGHVKDFESGQSIEGAKIYVNSVLMDTTNVGGNFQFKCLMKESSRLEVRKMNYISQTLTITTIGNGEMILPDIRLMDRADYSGSIKGNVMLGVIPNIASTNTNTNTNPYEDVKVMATVKDTNNSGTIFWIFSDIADVDSDGDFYIKHARIHKNLTVIGFIDEDNDNIIDKGEFFAEHYDPADTIYLFQNQQKEGVKILMQPAGVNSSWNNKIINFEKPPKGE